MDDHPGKGLEAQGYLTDPHYRQDFEEVREFGAWQRRSRTAEQSVIGVYWGYDGAQGIGVPPRLYNQIARKIAAVPSLNLPRTAELFAEINVAMADAGIDAWHWKYDQNLWRPVVAIRAEAAPDGDPLWAPYGAPQTNKTNTRPTTPPFPAYPSGHATFGAALFQVLRLRSAANATAISPQDVLDAEAGGAPVSGESFKFVSDEFDGRAVDADGSLRQRIEREIPSYARAIWENAVSRVYLGVHWRFGGLPRNAADNIGGVPLGLKVGKKVHAFFAAAPSLGGP
ncbi:MAG TPA: vanadium-dependent haloperoxidase [Geminicoccaceae bacterium]|nr:vanadium-dependent haloperoxidase [Geminicoccaceae bacterium]